MESYGEYTVRGQVKRYCTFSSLSQTHAYFIGYLACDGSYISCESNRGYSFMAVSSKDLYILERFKEQYCPDATMIFLGKKSTEKVRAINDVWEVRFPRKMNEAFLKFGVFNFKLHRRVVGVSNRVFPAYMAGCIDSDGFISVKHRKDCRTPRLTFYITHQSCRFLQDLQERLAFWGVNSYVRPHGSGAYRLSAQNTTQNILFLSEVLPFIRNKKRQNILSEYLSVYNYVPQASGELLETPTRTISSQAVDTSTEGSETTGEV